MQQVLRHPNQGDGYWSVNSHNETTKRQVFRLTLTPTGTNKKSEICKDENKAPATGVPQLSVYRNLRFLI